MYVLYSHLDPGGEHFQAACLAAIRCQCGVLPTGSMLTATSQQEKQHQWPLLGLSFLNMQVLRCPAVKHNTGRGPLHLYKHARVCIAPYDPRSPGPKSQQNEDVGFLYVGKGFMAWTEHSSFWTVNHWGYAAGTPLSPILLNPPGPSTFKQALGSKPIWLLVPSGPVATGLNMGGRLKP